MKKLITTTLLISTLSLSAFAGGGSADTGGGNAVGNQLLDLFENEGTTAINVTQLKAYLQVLKPLFASIDKKIPGFTQYITAGVEDKTWLMDPKPLSKACINESMIDVARTPVACQTNLQVRIFEPWYKKVDLKNQAALILHELIRKKALRRERSDEEVNYITRIILAADNYTGRELQGEIAKTGFGILGTDADIFDVQVYIATLYQTNCVRKPTLSAVDFMNSIVWYLSGSDFYGPRSNTIMLFRDNFKDYIFNGGVDFNEKDFDAKVFKLMCKDLKNGDFLTEKFMLKVNNRESY